MAKNRQSLRVRVSQTAGRRRKKPTSRVERMFDEVKALVSGTGDRLLGRSAQGKKESKPAAAKKTGTSRIRAGRQRQAAAKKASADRIRSGRQRQATKKAARSRGVKTS